MSGNGASSVGRGELEELVVSVLSVLREASAPDVVIVCFLLEGVAALGGALISGPGSDLIVDEGVEAVAGDAIEGGRNVAVGVECVVMREVRLAGNSNGGEDGEGLHFYQEFL